MPFVATKKQNKQIADAPGVGAIKSLATSGVRKGFLKRFADTFKQAPRDRGKSSKSIRDKAKNSPLFKRFRKEDKKRASKVEQPEKSEFEKASKDTRVAIGVRGRARRRAAEVNEKFRQSQRMDELAPSVKSAGRVLRTTESRKLNSRNQRRAQGIIEDRFKKLKSIRNKKRRK